MIGADVQVKARYNHLTALHIAAFLGFELAVQWLLDRGASIEAKTQDNLAALHRAALGFEFVVQQQLERGADVEAEGQWCGGARMVSMVRI